MQPKRNLTPWIIAFIWASVIALAISVSRGAKRDRMLQEAVQRELGPDVGLHGVAAMRLTGDQLNLEVTSSATDEQEAIAYEWGRRFGELKKNTLGDGSGCVVLLHNGSPVMHITTKKDGSIGQPVKGGPP